MTDIHITKAFDGGNISLVSISSPTQDSASIDLNINKDGAADFMQWFYYCASGIKGRDLSMRILNAGQASYTKGWENYRACASYDRETWFRIETTYADGILTLSHKSQQDRCYYAYFAPYSMEQHHDLIASCLSHLDVSLEVLGQSIDGQNMDCLSIGTGAKTIWVIARQHPGETQAQWWMDGFLARLLDDDDPIARVLRTKATFHIVPNMNPDGSFRGHLRTNTAGANLNREWGKATVQNSPEVYYVQKSMEARPPHLCLDVHGDEGLPYNFIAGAEGIPGWTDKMAKDQEAFLNAYKLASPDFQTEYGYPVAAPGTSNMTYCTSHTAQAFNCLSMTLEMPFKDNADLPDKDFGWSPPRCENLGRAVLDPMLTVIDQL